MERIRHIVFLTVVYSILSFQAFAQLSDVICFDGTGNGSDEEPCMNWRDYIYIDTVQHPNNIWNVGVPAKLLFNSSLSLPNAIITGARYPYPPDDTSVFIYTFRLKVPHDNTKWTLSYRFQLDIDSSSIARTEFSADSGKTWKPIGHELTSQPAGVTGLMTSSMSGNPWMGRYIQFDGDMFLGNDSMKLKFTFISGKDTSGKEGWMIDNIMGNAPLEIPAPSIQRNVMLYPNPAVSSISVFYLEEINSLVVSDVMGRTIYVAVPQKQQAIIDIADFPVGQYVLRINGKSFGSFIKK